MLVLLSDTRRSDRACRFAPTSFTNQGLFIPDSLRWTVMNCGWTCNLQRDRSFTRRRGSTLRYHSYHTRPREDHRAWYAPTLPHWGIPSSTDLAHLATRKKGPRIPWLLKLVVREKEQPCCCYWSSLALSLCARNVLCTFALSAANPRQLVRNTTMRGCAAVCA